MELFQPIAEKIAAHLIERGETIAIAESSTGGLVAASLLAISGASAYFAGGAVVYTKASRMALLNIGDADMSGLRPATEAYSLLIARRVRERHGATWGFGETGASGPTGNRYGDPPAIPAWRLPDPLSERLACVPAARTGGRIWTLSPAVHWNLSTKRYLAEAGSLRLGLAWRPPRAMSLDCAPPRAITSCKIQPGGRPCCHAARFSPRLLRSPSLPGSPARMPQWGRMTNSTC